MSITICVLMGLPAAGKTTLTHHLKQYIHHNEGNTHLCVITYDKMLPEKINFTDQKLYNADSEPMNNTWKEYRNQVYIFVQNIIKSLRSMEDMVSIGYPDDLCNCLCSKVVSMVTNHIVVIDDNMFYRSMRYVYYQLARTFKCSYCQVYIKADIETIISRNTERKNSSVSNETIFKMYELLEEPDPGKNTWEENTFVISKSNEFTTIFIRKMFEFIIKCSEKIVPALTEIDDVAKELDKQKCLDSLVHQIDQILRKFISEEMRTEKQLNNNKRVLNQKGKLLNEKRKNFLDLVRKQNVSIDLNEVATGQSLVNEVATGQSVVTDTTKNNIKSMFEKYINE